LDGYFRRGNRVWHLNNMVDRVNQVSEISRQPTAASSSTFPIQQYDSQNDRTAAPSATEVGNGVYVIFDELTNQLQPCFQLENAGPTPFFRAG